jgi:hypothetical protein
MFYFFRSKVEIFFCKNNLYSQVGIMSEYFFYLELVNLSPEQIKEQNIF